MPELAQALRLCLAILAISGGAANAGQRPDDVTVNTANTQYRNAIDDARAGLFDKALRVLQPLVERFPDRQDILNDYAVVLGWSGDHAAVLALFDRIDRVSAPAYVVESLARSALQLRRFDLAEALYSDAIARFPERVEPRIGLARTLAAAGNPEGAA